MSSINTNIMSINAQRNLARTQLSMSVAMQRLSSGMRVNGAADDAAGLAIAGAHGRADPRHECGHPKRQ